MAPPRAAEPEVVVLHADASGARLIVQQVEVAVAAREEWDAVCFADSDLIFVEEFAASNLWRTGALRLYRDDRKPHFYADRRYRNWYASAARMLGLGNPAALPGAYITQLITMRSDSVRRMCTHIESQTGRPWMTAPACPRFFRVHCLRGLRRARGREPRPFHGRLPAYYAPVLRCQGRGFATQFSGDQPEQVALLVQSNLGIPVEQVRALLDDLS